MTPVRRLPKLRLLCLCLAASFVPAAASAQAPFPIATDHAAQSQAEAVKLPTLDGPSSRRPTVFGRTTIDPQLAPAGYASPKRRRTASAKDLEPKPRAKAKQGVLSRWGWSSWFSRSEESKKKPIAQKKSSGVDVVTRALHQKEQRSGKEIELATASDRQPRARSQHRAAPLPRDLSPFRNAKAKPIQKTASRSAAPEQLSQPKALKKAATAKRLPATPQPLPLAGSNKKPRAAGSVTSARKTASPRPAAPSPRGRQLAPTPRMLSKSKSLDNNIPMVSDGPTRATQGKNGKAGPLPLIVENKIALKAAPPKSQDNKVVFVTDSGPAPKPTAKATKPIATAAKPARVAPPNPSPSTGPLPGVIANRSALQPVAIRRVTDKKPSRRAVELLSSAAEAAGSANTVADFTRVVQQCRHVLAIDQSQAAVDYANELASWALNKRGELRADAQQMEDAINDFNEALHKDKNRWRARHNRGVLHAQAGRYAEAFNDFNEVIRQKPDFAKAYSNRASLYVQAGDLSLAMEDYQRSIDFDPDLAVAHKGRGRVCHMLGMIEQSLQHFDAAVLLAPDDAHNAACRADLLVDSARYGQAIAGYRHAIALDPKLAAAYRNLAWLYATCPKERFRDGQAAVELANKAVNMLGDNDTASLDTLAAAHAAAGDFDAAIRVIRKAIAAATGADAAAYATRLKLYERGEAFLSTPVAEVQQAAFEQQ